MPCSFLLNIMFDQANDCMSNPLKSGDAITLKCPFKP